MRANEIGLLAADGVRDVLAGTLGDTPVADYAETDPLGWAVLRDGGWDELGVPEDAGGAGATLRDLAEVAMVCGEFCLPSPLTVTIAAKRWSATARDQDAPVTVAVRTRAGNIAPFGRQARPLCGLGDGPDGFLDASAAAADTFAMTLRPVAIERPTVFSPQAARELAVLWAAEGVGAARRCLADSVEYASGRKQFGVPIGSFQAVKHRAAHTLELTERAETAVLWAAADSYREGHESIESRRLLLHSLTTAQEVVESAVQIHGGMGFTWEMGLHVFLRHVVTLRELVDGLLPD
ncbi:acyl-CoA dehydrogenase family protein [Pseudonocardia endophytica]|nr:acyl-CoA dehydrogenase family protein [Pseudonocardia endophytica]